MAAEKYRAKGIRITFGKPLVLPKAFLLSLMLVSENSQGSLLTGNP